MADLTLRIAADFQKASDAFKSLASESEETRAKIEKFSESFQDKHIDSFIDKQKLLQSSLTGTRGETVAMQQASNNYQKEIERLIKSGLDPNSEAIVRLRNEQQALNDKIQETNDIQKSQNDLMKTAEKATMACYAAIGAGVAAIAAMTQKTAEMGDKFAKTSRIIGMTAETFQELQYAAGQNGIKDITPHLEKLNKTVVDVRNGTGALTKYLQDNDTELLTQIENVNSNEEAFNLLMNAIKRAPDEFTKAQIATAAFGKSGQSLINMAEQGTEGISALREEARKYGIISNEVAKQSELYVDAQTRLKAAITGVSTTLTSRFIPSATETINKLANFIASIDDWDKILSIAGYTLAGVTAGLTAFLVVTKGASVVHTFTTAIKALNAAIAANPIGALAVVITAILIPALIYLYKNWDTVQTYLQQGIGRLEYAFKWFASVIKEKFIVAVNTIKIGFISLADLIVGKVLGGVAKLLEVLGKLPFVGDMFTEASNKVKSFSESFHNLSEDAKRNSQEVINAAKAEQDATEQALRDKLNGIDAAAQARRTELEAQKKQTEESIKLDQQRADNELEILSNKEIEKNKLLIESETLKAKTESDLLKEKLEILNQIEIEKIEEQKSSLLENEIIYNEEKVEISKQADEEIANSAEQLNDILEMSLEKRLETFTSYFNGFSQLLEVLGEKNVGFAIAGKATASAEALINSYLAFTKALASGPPPFNYIAAAGVLAAGLASQVKIVSTPIPSAETGGRFIVPNSPGVDGSLLRVNKGEVAEITPRGMTGNRESFNFSFSMDGYVFAKVINHLAKSGELHSLQLAGNL